MKFTDVRYYGADFQFHTGDVEVEEGRITAVIPHPCQPTAMLLPGLIDIHVHGNSGADVSDGDGEGLLRMARFLAINGTTGFSPASMTLPEETLARAYRTAAQLHQACPSDAARLYALTMEGPFFSAEKKGAQNAAYLHAPDAGMLARLQKEAEGLIRIACVAPELPGAMEFIEAAAAAGIRVSLAHTAADYDTAAAAFDRGASHLTHTFNAMQPMLHRVPGPIAAAAERDNVTAELIADGLHVHPAMVRMAFRMFGPGRVCLISDAISACGMPDGTYMLGGQQIHVTGSRATLADGILAGSVATLFACLRNAIRFGIPAEEAVRAATATPARVIGIDDEAGAIREGYSADLLLCSLDWELQAVCLRGQMLKR